MKDGDIKKVDGSVHISAAPPITEIRDMLIIGFTVSRLSPHEDIGVKARLPHTTHRLNRIE
jgi:hypothetical protein